MEEKADFDPENSDSSSQNIELSKLGTEAKEKDEISRINFEGSEDGVISISSQFSDEEDEEESLCRAKATYFHIPYGFQSIGCYRHASKNCEIGGGKFNSKEIAICKLIMCRV
jgi:hypothetical protein